MQRQVGNLIVEVGEYGTYAYQLPEPEWKMRLERGVPITVRTLDGTPIYHRLVYGKREARPAKLPPGWEWVTSVSVRVEPSDAEVEAAIAEAVEAAQERLAREPAPTPVYVPRRY